MESVNALFLQAFNASLQNKNVNWDRDFSSEEWTALFRVAESHRVLPMIYEAVYSCPSAKKADGQLFRSFRQRTLHTVMVQALKTRAFLELLNGIIAAGVTPVVVKGLICRELYPKPDHRLSGDEDVLIPADQFALCHKAMCEFGMEPLVPEQDFAHAYEVPYGKKDSMLYVELHKQLFPPDSEAYGDWNRFFEGVQERAVAEHIQGVSVPTMGYTDHLLYLICHALKHFMHSGFGIRQVCDICLYANAYGAEIQWETLLTRCRELRADRFAAALFRIGEKHLTFDPDKACLPESWRAIGVDERAMLEDLLDSGIYGADSMSRKHSSNITLNAVSAKKRGGNAGNGVLKTVFPSAKNLSGRYPYLREKPYLLPVAWADRLLKYRRETAGSSDNHPAESVRIGNQRVRLMKQYGIIE